VITARRVRRSILSLHAFSDKAIGILTMVKRLNLAGLRAQAASPASRSHQRQVGRGERIEPPTPRSRAEELEGVSLMISGFFWQG
jgi:hypothetical protein